MMMRVGSLPPPMVFDVAPGTEGALVSDVTGASGLLGVVISVPGGSAGGATVVDDGAGAVGSSARLGGDGAATDADALPDACWACATDGRAPAASAARNEAANDDRRITRIEAVA